LLVLRKEVKLGVMAAKSVGMASDSPQWKRMARLPCLLELGIKILFGGAASRPSKPAL
jgi:hypothetical protein